MGTSVNQLSLTPTKPARQKGLGFGQIQGGPNQQFRSCTDICCIFVFALIFLVTFGGGGYFIYIGRDHIAKMILETQQNATNQPGFAYILATTVAPITGMLVLSSFLSVTLVLLAKSFPYATMVFLTAFAFVVYIGFIIVGFVMNSLGLAISFIVILLITALLLFCFKEDIEVGLKLLQCAARFITQKPAVYFIALMSLALNIGYLVFWTFSWVGVYSTGFAENDEILKILTYIWYIDSVFWGFFLYYCMTFLVASACAYWYYQSQNNSVLRGINNIKYHLGSICFGSIVITIITFMRVLAETKKSQNAGLRFLASITECLLKCIQNIIKVLNNNAIIVMAVTGQSYIDSANTALDIITDNIGLFMIIEYFSNFFSIFCYMFIALVPAFIGGGIIYKTQQAQSNPLASNFAIYGGIIIFFLAILICSVIIGVLLQALNSIFIFFCLDLRFKSMGLNTYNIPEEISQIFYGAQKNTIAEQFSMDHLTGGKQHNNQRRH